MEQGSKEWLEWRMSGVGASEVAAIVGVCPYNTPHGVWLEKTRRKAGFEGNSFTEHGKDMEAKARARYELTNMDDLPPALATHPKFKMCIASLDGLTADNKLILEIKCPKGQSTLQLAKAGKLPENYMAQCQYQLAITGAELLHFYVYHSETAEDALVEVRPDVEYQGMLIAKVYDFWKNHVLTDIPPELTERDVKEIDDDKALADVCALIKDGAGGKLKKPALDALKAEAMRMGGHPKIRCNGVQLSTVNRNGKFSYYKLTIASAASEQVGA